MRFTAKTDIGKRYKSNEDFYVLPMINKKVGIEYVNPKAGMLFVLCDGMGGGNAGEVASKLTATWITKDYYGEKKTKISSLLEKFNKPKKVEMQAIIRSVNKRLYKLSKEYEQYNGMGTTLVTALFKDEKIFIDSVGDSRCYRFRNNELLQLTEDQSEVWNLFKMGAITKDEIRSHPRNNIITMAIGTIEDIEINEYEYTVQKKDIYLLCCDGLTDMVSEDDIKKILMAQDDLEIKANKLIQAANDAGGKDNITVILIEI